uniref:NADH dehydrogenase subunit 6 n=1 Tax=Malaxella flava TaxID=871443 RepID=A0A7S5DBT7_9HEMI|nr:NADH dehydrogenase subunit 6 [Malaxella flava]QBZ38131.1 NADH dehydrogenase subunit 6 [Malaxella flava]
MKKLLLMMTLNSLMTIFMKHPISMGSILMIQSIITSTLMTMLTKNSWYSMILFVTFSSGMMIMFMYMSSISSNEKFKASFKFMNLMLMMMILTTLLKIDWNFLLNFKLTDQILNFKENEEMNSIIKNISFNKLYLTILLTTIILMTLIAISNLINSFEGPLKLTYEIN